MGISKWIATRLKPLAMTRRDVIPNPHIVIARSGSDEAIYHFCHCERSEAIQTINEENK
ncbi:hypothetical protein [Helicobacter didelphidarum]|uniref:hypothetical protein n=1 Tax=Helicobacter didelphidarum TaxID=2040648 RepID=UPI0015F1A053|nr:hypothetical protein [Helicobacter didelphidarum]